MPDLPKFNAWPENFSALSPAELLHAYSDKRLQGCIKDPAGEELIRAEFQAETGYGSLGDLATSKGWADSAAGQLVFHNHLIEQMFPGWLPGDRQNVGSCVSHSTCKAASYTLLCELLAGKPDPVSGVVEGRPEVPEEGILSGIFAPFAIYRFRGYRGHGWSCPASVQVVKRDCGLVVMKKYPELGLDYTNTTTSLENLSNNPTEAERKLYKEHLIRSSAEVNSFEEIRDALANGYGITSCGSEGFSSTCDENGVARRSGSWAHAMAYIGADDRQETKAKYGEPLVLVQNSWGNWNSGGRRIMGTTLDKPIGSFWTPYSSVKNRYACALANAEGWPPGKLPDYGTDPRW